MVYASLKYADKAVFIIHLNCCYICVLFTMTLKVIRNRTIGKKYNYSLLNNFQNAKLSIRLEQCFSTGVPQHTSVPWATSKFAAKLLVFTFTFLFREKKAFWLQKSGFTWSFSKISWYQCAARFFSNVKCAAS